MKLAPGLHRTTPLEMVAARREMERAGYTTFVLPAEGIIDRASFFDAVRATLPLDPPLVGSCSWDALSDSLWEGLHAHAARRIAIVWPGTRAMESSAPSELETALSVLADVASTLSDPRATLDRPKEVVVLVA
jgi:hypothetical protein